MTTAFMLLGVILFVIGFVSYLFGQFSSSMMVLSALLFIIGGMFWLIFGEDDE